MRDADAVMAFHALTRENGQNPRIQWAVYYEPDLDAVCIRGTIRSRRTRHTDRRWVAIDGVESGVAVEIAKHEISDIAYALSSLASRRE